MKKILKALCLATILLLPLVGCNNNPDTEEITIQKQIDADSTVDLNGETISEDVTINKNVTLKNADFNGHTITVNADTTLTNITNANVVIAGTNTAREAIIGKAITLTISGNSTITSITVKIENAKITSLGDKVTITSLEIGSEVENVDISGGIINELKAIKDSNILNISGTLTISKVIVIDNTGNETTGNIYVTAPEDFTPPSNIKKVTITDINIIGNLNKINYEVGDPFDFTGLSVEVTYSDGSKKTLLLSNTITKVYGLPSSTTGEKNITLTVSYNGFEKSKTFTVTVTKSTKNYVNLLNEAVDCFADMDFDNGLAKINAAYDETKNDTTKMYYALATLACVSTDSATVDFMRNTCGFESYPNTLNAIITTPWYEDCIQEGFVEKIVAANPKGFNDALNKLVSIIETAYDKTVAISSGIEQESVLLPARLIEVLNLNEVLGSAADIRLGKAQLDMILAYVGIIKGALQYVSAFDWTFNTSTIATGMDIDDFVTAIKSGTKLFTVADKSMLEKSKNSFVASVDLIMSSYDYILTSSSSIYPDEVKEVMQAYSILYDAAAELKKAISKGKAFYVPDTNIFELTSWPTSDASDWLVKIDCGKMFSANVLDNAIKKDSSGTINFYTAYSYYDGSHHPENEETLLTGSFYSVHEKNVAKVQKTVTTSYWECYTHLLIKVRLPDCITINGIEDRETFLPIWGEYTDSYDDYN